MRRVHLTVLVVTAFAGLARSADARPSRTQETVVVFRNVDVVPMDRERVLEDRVVVVERGLVRAIEPSEGFDVPAGARVIEGKGRCLVPGLVDMHVHLRYERPFQESLLDVYLAHGITTVVNLWGGASMIELREAIDPGDVGGPRVVTSGPGINDSRLDYEGGIELVRAQERAGYDFLKIYSDLSAEGFEGIAVEASESGMRMVGHVPSAVGLRATLEAGQEMIAHVEELLYGHLRFRVTDVSGTAEAGLEANRIPEMVELLIDHETWITPTLIAFERIIDVATDLEAVQARPAVALVPPAIRLETGWTERSRYRTQFSTPEHGDRLRATLAFQRELVLALHEAGVPILAGTDAMNPGVVPGADLHTELERLVGAGLSPYEALVSATRRPAEFLRSTEKAGRVVVGAPADLVLLESNPLEDIRHTTGIAGVMVRGDWLPSEELDAQLARVRRRHEAQAEFLGLLELGEVSKALEFRRRTRERDPAATLFSEISLRVAGQGVVDGEGGASAALPVFVLLTETYPSSPRAWAGLAETALAAGERESARKAFRRALELNPAGSIGRRAARELENLEDGR